MISQQITGQGITATVAAQLRSNTTQQQPPATLFGSLKLHNDTQVHQRSSVGNKL